MLRLIAPLRSLSQGDCLSSLSRHLLSALSLSVRIPMEADTDAPNVEAVDDVPAAEEEVITPEQEEALKNVDIDLQERLRKAIRNRLSMIKKKENLDVGDGDDDDKIWQRYETFTQYIKTFGKVLRKHNIPFDDDDHEEQQGPKKVVIDCTAIPALNEWLTEFYNTPPDPARNTVNGVQIVDYSRPEPQDIVKQLTLIEEDAKANEADDVLELLKNHVGDNKEKFALNVFQKLLALNKRQTVGKVKETWQKIAAKHNVTLDITPKDEPSSTSLSRVNEEPASYPEASQEIVAAI
uniref:Ku_PK_bind domain-containing protein n=1 Tax=Steinernema glaseri TaxID=37863 RepID=A0A1I7YC76_9BILA